MLLAHLYHSSQNVVPSFGLHHNIIGEHTPIPTDMPDFFGKVAVFISQPMAGIHGDVQFSVWIRCLAMPSRFIMGTGSEHRTIILGHVKINGPWAKCGSNGLKAFCQCSPI